MIEDVRDNVEGLALLVICTTASLQTRLHIGLMHCGKLRSPDLHIIILFREKIHP